MEVLLICGGTSFEREISLQSAQFFLKYIKHNVHVLVIDEDNTCQLNDKFGNRIGQDKFGAMQIIKDKGFICQVGNYQFTIDVVLPILHGKFGEDGTVQGWLELLGVPYVGCGVLASAICMDKDISKRLVQPLGINTAEYFVLNRYDDIPHEIDYPVFVKPIQSGSSIGISKVNNKNGLEGAIKKAFQYDEKIIIEQAIEQAREIEIAILEADELIISIPGEIIVNHEFYSYEAKYLDADGATLSIPAELTNEQRISLQKKSKLIFQALNCSGMARIDFLLQDKEIFFNEINTIPGFTEISLYPNLLKASGISYSQLIDILLENALK